MSLKHACLTLVVCAAASGASADVVNLNTGAPGSGWTVQQTSGSSNTGGPLNATSAAVALTGTLPLAVNLPGFEAFAWANKKVELIPITPTSNIADFKNWNAKAFYFYDNNQNIVEFIARFDLDNNSDRKSVV